MLADRPLQLNLYHGAGEPFEAFRPELVGSRHADIVREDCADECIEPTAFYFSSDLETAIWYATSSAAKLGRPPAEGVVLTVSLSLTNPKVVDFQGEGREYLAEELASAKRGGHDGLVCMSYDDGVVSDHYIVFDAAKISILKTSTVTELESADQAALASLAEPPALPSRQRQR